eukprot:2805721-Pyramimonas_sp.AAC.1
MTGGLTGPGHLVMESGVVEETLDDVAVRMVQWAVVIGFAQHPACTRRWGTRVRPPLVPRFRLSLHLPRP